jgi:hypothetical protein
MQPLLHVMEPFYLGSTTRRHNPQPGRLYWKCEYITRLCLLILAIGSEGEGYQYVSQGARVSNFTRCIDYRSESIMSLSIAPNCMEDDNALRLKTHTWFGS